MPNNLVDALIELAKKKGLEIGESIEIKFDPIVSKDVSDFIKLVEDAYKRTKNHNIKFNYAT